MNSDEEYEDIVSDHDDEIFEMDDFDYYAEAFEDGGENESDEDEADNENDQADHDLNTLDRDSYTTNLNTFSYLNANGVESADTAGADDSDVFLTNNNHHAPNNLPNHTDRDLSSDELSSEATSPKLDANLLDYQHFERDDAESLFESDLDVTTASNVRLSKQNSLSTSNSALGTSSSSSSSSSDSSESSSMSTTDSNSGDEMSNDDDEVDIFDNGGLNDESKKVK